MTMWDSLSIPGQVEMLKKALNGEGVQEQAVGSHDKVVMRNVEPKNDENSKSSITVQGKDVRPPPFYVSLIIGKNLVHNCMVDSGATCSVMPK